MKHRIVIPPIPEAERTPLVIALVGIIEALAERVQRQEEQIEPPIHGTFLAHPI